MILGSLCRLRTTSQIHQWAESGRVSAFLREHFEISDIPCYYWLLCMLKLIKPESLNECFIRWVQAMVAEDGRKLTLSFDGKTICSTGATQGYESPLHIISAHIAELGITLGQQAVSGKSNEIAAMRELLKLLEIEGCMVVADALHCQRETAKAVVAKKADYLLCVKGNQETLKTDIAEYVQEEALCKEMDTAMTLEKNGGRIEKRTAFATCDVDWLQSRADWANLSCIGAIHREIESKSGLSSQWQYYISSRPLSAAELLRFARME